MQDYFRQINSAGVFSVTQWNTLADSLADGFPSCNDNFLKWDYRKRVYSDIICLEEVDHPEYFSSFLSNTHEILFHKKPEGNDGQLVAICKKKFTIIEKEPVHFLINDGDLKYSKKCNQSFWYILLKDNNLNKNVVIFVTHLKAKKQFEDIRVQQIDYFFQYLKQKQELLLNIPIVFLGDFNAEPTFECIQNINKSGLFKSAYEDINLEFSTYKIREHNDIQCRVIDYIFYTPSLLKLTSVKGLPNKEQIGHAGLPCEVFPSDHLSLSATFTFI